MFLFVSLGFPALFLLTLQRPLNQIETIDPYVYAAYINDFASTVERFGPTYYAARVAYIYPERAALSLFGVEAGYYAYQFFALFVATASVFVIGWRYYGLATAVFASAWLCFTPWLARSLTWTFYDGFTVVCLLLAGALLLVPVRLRLAGHTTAGAVFGLAVNCNLLLLVVGAAFLPGWLVINRNHGSRWMVRAGLCLFAGLVAGFAAPILMLEAEFPGIGFAAAAKSFSLAFGLLEGSDKWFKTLAQILVKPGTEILLIPGVLLVFGMFVLLKRPLFWWSRERASIALAASLYLAATVLLAFCMHYFFEFHWFGYIYYNVFFLPASALVLIALAGETETWWSSPSTLYFASAALFSLWLLLPLAWLGLRSVGTESVVIVMVAILLSVALCTFLYSVRSGFEPPALLSSILIFSFVPIFGGYDLVATSADRQREWDVYHGAIFLQQTVNADVPTGQTVGFWYSNQNVLLRSVQSIFLWEFTRVAPLVLQGDLSAHPGMPLLDEATRSAMLKNNYLVLLGTSKTEITIALTAIRGARLPFRFVRQARYEGQTWDFEMALLKEFPQILGAKLFDVPVSQLVPANGGQAIQVSDGVRLTTGRQRYGYYLIGPLQKGGEPWAGKGVVRVELEVEKGEIGVAVEHSEGSSELSEVGVRKSGERDIVDLEVPDLASVGRLIVRNYRTVPSTVTVHSIQVFRPN